MRPLRNEKKRRQYWKLKDQRLQQFESLMLWHVRRFMRDQQRRVLEQLPEVEKGLTETIFNKEQEKKLMAKTMLPVIKEVAKEEGQMTAERLGGEFEFNAEVERFVQERSNNLAGQVTDTTFDGIKSEIQAGFEAGESYDGIASRITDRYDQINTGRANTIARTEAHAAAQRGNLSGYKQTGVKTKIWVAVMDLRTRPSHQLLDGKETMVGQPFPNGLMYPGDPSGPPSEIVNCRCTL